jgi:hypothetical protein
MFEDSEKSLEILGFFDTKYGQLVAPIGLFKTCAVVSSQLQWPRLSILTVAPTRQFKSSTSRDVEAMFPESYIIHAGSDFTMHRLFKQTNGDVDRKCIFINDGTLLLRSKSTRGRDRLFNGLAELIADGEYLYGDYQNAFAVKGGCTAVVNMTLEAFSRYEKSLISMTFLERFLTLHYSMPPKEQHYFYETKKERAIKTTEILKEKLRIRPFKIANVEEYKKSLISLAKDFSALSLRSFLGCADQVEALAVSHAVLNERFWLCEDDLDVVRMAREYVVNPLSLIKPRIVQLHEQGRDQRDICLLLNKNYESYRPHVSRVLKEAKMRGIIE